MNTICAIVNAEGFYSEGTFYPREWAFAGITTDEPPQVLTIDLSQIKLSESSIYATKYYHGMLQKPEAGESCKTLESIDSKLKAIWIMFQKNGRDAVAFYGNEYWENICNRWRIPFVNLKDLDVPDLPFDDSTCGYHGNSVFGDVPACSLAKVKAWKLWCTKHE